MSKADNLGAMMVGSIKDFLTTETMHLTDSPLIIKVGDRYLRVESIGITDNIGKVQIAAVEDDYMTLEEADQFVQDQRNSHWATVHLPMTGALHPMAEEVFRYIRRSGSVRFCDIENEFPDTVIGLLRRCNRNLLDRCLTEESRYGFYSLTAYGEKVFDIISK